MTKWRNSPRYFLFLSAATFLMAVLSFSGVFLKADLVGRLIVGAVWSLVSIAWVSQYFHSRQKVDSR